MSENGGKGLETYRAMRDASRTPEPFGGRAGHRRIGEAAGAAALFAVHAHAALLTGALIFGAILEQFDCSDLRFSTRGLRFGAILA